jgi:flagellar hook-associated protein 2
MSINRVSGLATGIDTEQWLADLMKAHRAPLVSKQQDKQILDWKQEDYRSLNTSLFTFRNAVFDLKLQGNFLGKTTTSSDASIVTATAGTSAANTVYHLKVERLANVATNSSAGVLSVSSADRIDAAASLISQQSKFSNSGFSFDEDNNFSFTINDQTFSVDGDTATLNSVIKAVNANVAAGVTMFYDATTDKVAIATTQTGNNRTGAEIQVAGSFLTEVLQINQVNEKGGEDASLEINGLQTTRTTNTFTINGTTFNLQGTTPGGFSGTSTTLNIASNVDQVVTSIKKFVDSYNSILSSLNDKIYEERYSKFRPLSDEQMKDGGLTETQINAWQTKARSGLLKRDTILSGAVTSMRTAMSSVVTGLTGEITMTTGTQTNTTVADRLSKIGFTTGAYQENGKLYLDESKLREALQSNPTAVMELFTKNSENNDEDGIAVRLYDAVNTAMSRITAQAGTAGSLYDTSFITNSVRNLDKQMSKMQDRLEEMENRYWKQFTAMEKAISKMNSQSSWLAQQFSGGTSS